MKGQASAIEYVHLAREFQELTDGRIDKVYADGEYVLFTIYTGERRVHLILDIPHVAYLSEDKPSFDKASGYTMYLRRRLQGARIKKIEQVGMDRILRLILDTKEEAIHVYVELFGKGNLVLCEPDNTIISAMDATVYADRSFKKGATYQLPEAQLELRGLPENEFSQLFGEREAVKVLAADIGLGGEYAELICTHAGIDKNNHEPDTKKLYDEVQRVLNEYAPERAENAAYPVHMIDGAEPYDSFSKAIAAIRNPLRERAEREEHKQRLEKRESRVERIAKTQRQQIKGFERSQTENQRKGELLYEHYSDLKDLVMQAAKDRKQLSPEAFEKKWAEHPLVADADPQGFTIEIKK